MWARVGTYQHQNWAVPEDKQLLASIVGDDEAQVFYDIADTRVQNIELRKLLRESLRSKNTPRKNAAIKWIVYDWGNIPPREAEDEDRLFTMCAELKTYALDEVKVFVEKYKDDRIASWSKVIAFADSDSYAIYDARVAMSLNAVLDELEYPRKFYMPQSISKPLNAVFSQIKGHMNTNYGNKKHMYMGYEEYRLLLLNFVAQGLASSVLDAEMRLFAQGKKMGNSYATKHGLKIPYPEEK